MSLTLSGIIVSILALVFTPEEAETLSSSVMVIVDNVAIVVGILMTYWGRYRQGDITWYGKKLR